MDTAHVEQIRRFNRAVTQRIGALDDAFLSLRRPLGQARLLWEIGAEGSELRSLRARLALDSGYLSRLLRALQADGLVTVDIDAADGRVRRARLTPAGLAERAELDRRSDGRATEILRPLTAYQRTRLVAAMAEVERLLVASTVDIAVVDPRHVDARYCRDAYYAELRQRFEGGYDPDLAIPADDAALTPPAGLLLVARLHDEPVGCAALKLPAGEPAHLKRMWVSPAARGTGLGRRLLDESERQATTRGARVLRLETNRTLVEAIALYRATGYREVPPFNDEIYGDHWFEKDLGAPKD
jgi:DNA-binding MarR family transcriptional regulator/GNAT superfamily N-acetyltransferase